MRKHRGLSSIIGTVFLIAIVIGALSYVGYSMNILGNFSESLITEEKRQKDKQGEQFEITSINSTSANKLDGVVKNTGNVPLKIKSLWIEEIGNSTSITKFNVNQTIAPGKTMNLINKVNFVLNVTKGYSVKLISERGEIQTSYLNSASITPLFMSLHVVPNIVATNFPTTILFTVVNNMSNNNVLYNLSPNITMTGSSGSTVNLISGPTPLTQSVLKPGDAVTFEYVYTVAGIEGVYANFGVSLNNGFALDSSHYQSLNGTITVKDVEISISSGSSITSQGLESFANQPLDIMIFHDDTYNVPIVGSYQMDSSYADGSGTTFNTYTNNPRIYFSANTTDVNTVIQGKWNASLQYYTNTTTNTVPTPSFAFFFECDSCGETDSTPESIGNIEGFEALGGDMKKKGNAFPTWRDPTTITDGPDGDGYYSFTNNDGYLNDDWKVETENTYASIGAPPDTENIWIRIPPAASISNYMPVIRYGDEDDGKNPQDRYEISVGTASGSSANKGKISFNYETSTDASQTTTCTSPNTYNNSKWQMVTAVRESNGSCNLYINGSLVAGPVPGNTGSNTVDIRRLGVGTIDFASGDALNNLNADLGTWMHWNDKALTQAQAQELFYTNYGNNATRIHVTINQTDSFGNLIAVLADNATYSLPFHDPAVKSASNVYYYSLYPDSSTNGILKFTPYNYTTYIGNTTFAVGDRVSLEIKTDSNTQNLHAFIRTDDNRYSESTVATRNSFLQTPQTSYQWLTYLSYQTTAQIKLTVQNQGPGVWFDFHGTRLVLTSIDGKTSYSAMVKEISVNGTTAVSMNEVLDSPYVPNNIYAEFTFYELTNQPNAPAYPLNNRIAVTPGNWQTSIFLTGYDDAGHQFLKTVDIGIINIHL